MSGDEYFQVFILDGSLVCIIAFITMGLNVIDNCGRKCYRIT